MWQNDLNELLATHEKTANVRVIPIGDKMEDVELLDKGIAMRAAASRTHASQSAMKQDAPPQIHTLISAPTPATSGAASLDPLAPAPRHELYKTEISHAAAASMACCTTSPARARLLQPGIGISENKSGRTTFAALDPLRVSASQGHAPACPPHQDTGNETSSSDSTGPSDRPTTRAEVRPNDEESIGYDAFLDSKSGKANIMALDPLHMPTIRGPASSTNSHQHAGFGQSGATNTSATNIDILRHEDKSQTAAEQSLGPGVLDNYGDGDNSSTLDARCIPVIRRDATASTFDQKMRPGSSNSGRSLHTDRHIVRAEDPRGDNAEPLVVGGGTKFEGLHRSNDIQGHDNQAAAATCHNRVNAVTPAPSVAPIIMPSVRNIRWQRGNLIGQGAFGRVYMTLNLDTGELMAMKQLDTASVSSRERCALENEISMMKGLRHPNIVRYLGVDSSNDTLAIFLEYVPGGSLRSLLDRFGKLEEAIVRLYSRQILLGLEYLHSNGIAHRDIKAANVLVSNDGSVKLADFGASKRIAASSHANGVAVTGGAKGTPLWMAPEVMCWGDIEETLHAPGYKRLGTEGPGLEKGRCLVTWRDHYRNGHRTPAMVTVQQSSYRNVSLVLNIKFVTHNLEEVLQVSYRMRRTAARDAQRAIRGRTPILVAMLSKKSEASARSFIPFAAEFCSRSPDCVARISCGRRSL